MKIICLSCGHKIDLGDSYDDFDGPIRDATCGALLEIRTEGGNLRSVAILPGLPTAAPRLGAGSAV